MDTEDLLKNKDKRSDTYNAAYYGLNKKDVPEDTVIEIEDNELTVPTIKYFQEKTEEVFREYEEKVVEPVYEVGSCYAPSDEAHEVGKEDWRDKVARIKKSIKIPKIKIKTPTFSRSHIKISAPRFNMPQMPKIKMPKMPQMKKVNTARVINVKNPKIVLAKGGTNLPVPYKPAVQKYKMSLSDIKDRAKKAVGKVKADVNHCYDVTMNLASFYNLRHESVLGVDITPNCIYLCKIDGLNGKRVLTSMTSVVMEGKFMAEDIANNKDEYASSLKELIKENNIETKNVALSIPVSNSIVKTVTIPTMNDAEIKNALRFGSLWNNFMSHDKKPEDYSVFYQIIRRNKSSESMDVLFVATKLSDISLYTDIVKDSGLNPVIVDVRCFAVNNAFNHKVKSEDKGGPSVFLEFGFEDNYAMLIDEDGVQIYDISVTDTQRAALIGEAIDEEVIDSFVSSYTKQVGKLIAGYEKKNEGVKIKNVFVLSSVPQVGVVTDKMSAAMEACDVSGCNFFDCMDIDDDFTINSKSASINLSAWGAAIGGALRRLDIFGKKDARQKFDTNMIPAAYRYVYEKRNKYIINAVSAVASIAVLWFMVTTQNSLSMKDRELSEQLETLGYVEGNYNIIATKNDELEYATNGVKELDELIAQIDIEQKRLLYAHQYLNLVVLDDIWLNELNFTAPSKMEISGGAINDLGIIEFKSLLEGGEQFKDVALRGMEEVREVTIVRPDALKFKSFRIDSVIADDPVKVLYEEEVGLENIN